MNKVDEQPNNVTIVAVLILLVVGILTTGIQVVYESCWRSIFSAGRQRDSQLAILWESQYVMTRLGNMSSWCNSVSARLSRNIPVRWSVERESNVSPELNGSEEPYMDIACHCARDRASDTGWCVTELKSCQIRMRTDVRMERWISAPTPPLELTSIVARLRETSSGEHLGSLQVRISPP